jgi:hypothetical protein
LRIFKDSQSLSRLSRVNPALLVEDKSADFSRLGRVNPALLVEDKSADFSRLGRVNPALLVRRATERPDLPISKLLKLVGDSCARHEELIA